jgi:hypothetical protein
MGNILECNFFPTDSLSDEDHDQQCYRRHKEGVVNAIKEKNRSAITNSILETSDGTKSKIVDQIELHVFLKTVLDAPE